MYDAFIRIVEIGALHSARDVHNMSGYNDSEAIFNYNRQIISFELFFSW